MFFKSKIYNAIINEQKIDIEFKGKFNVSHDDTIRITLKHYNKNFSKVLDYAVKHNILTQENLESGNYNFYLEDENNIRYKCSYMASGLSNNFDNGYFFRKVNE